MEERRDGRLGDGDGDRRVERMGLGLGWGNGYEGVKEARSNRI